MLCPDKLQYRRVVMSYNTLKRELSLHRISIPRLPPNSDMSSPLADPSMGGPGGRPLGPNIGVFFNLNTKLLALFV